MNLIKLLRNSLYSKYKSGLTNFYISKINLILFKQDKGHYKPFIGTYLKEMYIYSDYNEYIKKYFYKSDSNIKLKVLGYIYFHNFKSLPNYLNLENNIYNIMCELLTEKQNLIDRNIATNCILYEKSRNKNNRYTFYKIDDDNNFFNDINFNKSNNSSFSNKNQNLEKNTKNDYVNKNFVSYTRFNEAKNKEKEINNNSTDSIKNLVKKFKKVNINIINKNKINFIKSINSKDLTNKLKVKNLQNNQNKKVFVASQQLLLNNKNNIRELIKSRNSKHKNIIKDKLTVEDFKENLRKSKKSLVKKYLDNYWKQNKNFVKNLIENKNIIEFNKIILHKRYFSINHSENINNFLTMRTPLRNKSIKIKLKTNSINKKFSQKNKKFTFNNTLINKIRNNSDFMKNKNFRCVYYKESINSGKIFSVKKINFSNRCKS